MTVVNDLAAEYWRLRMELSPTYATLLGIHEHDARIEDVSRDVEDTARSRFAALLDRARDIDPDTLEGDELVTHGLLVQEIEEAILTSGGEDGEGVRLVELSCDQMGGPQALLLVGLPQMTLLEPAHADAIVERYRAIPTFLDQAADRFRDSVEAGRTHVARGVEALLAQVDGYLRLPLDGDPLLGLAAPADWEGAADWRERLAAVVRDDVRPALGRFRERVAAEIRPAARGDDEGGLCHLPGGDAIYADLVRMHTSLELDPAEVHQWGLEAIEALRGEYSEIGARAFRIDDPAAVFDRLRSDPALRYSDGATMVSSAEEAIRRATETARDWFRRLPSTDCVVAPVPEALAASSPPAFYLPPATDGSRPGTYFLNTADPSAMHTFEAQATAYHEAVPGHHLQIGVASELDHLPDFRRHGRWTAYSEGWGLYAERLAEEMGLYSTDIDRLGMLALDSFRAARLVVDTGLHVQGWSRQRAVDYMTENTPLPQGSIESEVDRYLVMPGQALAYKIGQREILRLRREAETALGARFDVRDFHAVVLDTGPVTLPVLGQLVDAWVAAAA